MALLSTGDIVKRLAFIRYIHTLAVEQARQPVPLSSAAVLLCHAAVEDFLVLVGDNLGAQVRAGPTRRSAR